MKTRTRTKNHKAPRRLSGVNPYARPRRSVRPAQSMALPRIVERPELYAGIPMAYVRGEELPWDLIKVWELTYRCIRRDGRRDREVSIRSILAATRAKALGILQELLRHSQVEQIELYHVRGPLTLEQIAELKRLNEQRPWLDTDSHG